MTNDGYRETSGPGDDPAEAFERLRGEVSLLRHAIGALTTARENVEIPDYEPTLARTEKVMATLVQQIEGMRKSPAFTLTPEQMSREIVSSALHARREDQRLITEARTGLEQAVRDIGNRVASARRGDEQTRWVLRAGLGGLVLGLLLYALMAGPIARLAPASWQWPERMAARTLDMSMWEGGQRMMRAAAPDAFANIAAGDRIVTANRETLEACHKAAARAKKPVRCSIEVKGTQDRP